MKQLTGVLVVDDMPHTRKLVCRVLDREGFDTFEAEDQASACAAAASHHDHIDVALVDVELEGASASEVRTALQRQLPDARFVFMTRLDIDTLVAEGRLPDNAVVLRKPFTLSALVDTVRATRRRVS
ncbi:MAG: response regulator [Acidobacteria bacterium]|nr:response regulator [Acidobacteriota bacterium]